MPSNSRKNQLRFHESTQRALCRMVFLWLALIPVLAVASFSILKRTPWYMSEVKKKWQGRLSENLGVAVSFESIEFPSPFQFRTVGLICSNPETGRDILKVAQANVDIDRSGWSVRLSDPRLNNAELQNAMTFVDNGFIRRPQKIASLLKLSLPELTIEDGVEDGVDDLKLQNVEVGLKPSDTASLLIVTFSIEGQRDTTSATFRIDRNHSDESTRWQIDTHGLQIPCHFVSERFPSVRHLGNLAQFRGKIDWSQTKENWGTRIDGNVFNVDLGRASISLQNPLNGFGDLTIDSASIIGGDLRELRGSLHSRNCSLETGWLDRAPESVKLFSERRNIAWSDLGPKAEARHLGIRFELRPDGLIIGDNPKHKDLVAVMSPAAVSQAIATYAKPIPPEPQPSRIADGRRP